MTDSGLASAKATWLKRLAAREQRLVDARIFATDDMAYGGAAISALNIEPLEREVAEAKLAISALRCEMQARNQKRPEPALAQQLVGNIMV